jgi:hypothetical protein
MSERTLFDYVVEVEPDPPCQRHSVTSREAADAIKPDASELRRRVLAYLRARGEGGAGRDGVGGGQRAEAEDAQRAECGGVGGGRKGG